jgi:hypothetical protein
MNISFVDSYQHFEGTCCFHLQDQKVKMDPEGLFEEDGNNIKRTCHIPQDSSSRRLDIDSWR